MIIPLFFVKKMSVNVALKMFQENKGLPPVISQIKHTIAVAAGKGGVGKSSLTVNLALSLKEKGYKVGVLDADIYGPSIRMMLPENCLPLQSGDCVVPALCDGIKMISMAYFTKDFQASVIRAPIVNRILNQFVNNVAWGELDFLIVDFPPGTGDIQLSLSQHTHLTGTVIVTTPQEVALLDVRKTVDMFHQMGIPLLGIVENMSYLVQEKTGELLHIFGKNGGKRLSQELGVPFLGEIPLDPALCNSGDKGISIFADDASLSAKSFRMIRDNLLVHFV